jgi:hypothetical protein
LWSAKTRGGARSMREALSSTNVLCLTLKGILLIGNLA